ncbi:DUF3489 domain-containing protein [Sphingomonas antarctica]|uniref:DUF3489 domain-containing protein n=1 Tax=Sphingomonas antarctica TaxID=2040274 RepID=UPI0039EC369C
MTDNFDEDLASAAVTTPMRAAPTKAATVAKLLSRNRGATLTDIMTATQWQPHSARAFLSGLRKKGKVLIKEARKDGETSYRTEA